MEQEQQFVDCVPGVSSCGLDADTAIQSTIKQIGGYALGAMIVWWFFLGGKK